MCGCSDDRARFSGSRGSRIGIWTNQEQPRSLVLVVVDMYSMPQKRKVKRFDFYNVFLFILGTIFPPLAVAARFGAGKDLIINTVLTICGYIPGHVHNFYIQNIRNNKNHSRTPKWAQRHGLVDTTTIERHERRSRWANRYKDRHPRSALEGQPLEEGQVESSAPNQEESSDTRKSTATPDQQLWNSEDEHYYQHDGESVRTSESGHGAWRYTGENVQQDRWAKTNAAHNQLKQKKEKKRSGRAKRRRKEERREPSESEGAPVTTDALVATDAPVATDDAPVTTDVAEPASGGTDIFTHEL